MLWAVLTCLSDTTTGCLEGEYQTNKLLAESTNLARACFWARDDGRCPSVVRNMDDDDYAHRINNNKYLDGQSWFVNSNLNGGDANAINALEEKTALESNEVKGETEND